MRPIGSEIDCGVRVPTSVGVMILSNAVLFPGAMLPLRIFEPRYRRMLKDALASHRMFCVAMQRPGNTRETPLPVAGLGVIRYAVRDEDGTSRLLLQGIARVELGPTKQYKPYRLQVIRPLLCGKDDGETPEVDALRFKALELAERRLNTSPPVSMDLFQSLANEGLDIGPVAACMRALRSIANPGQLADVLALLLVEDAFFRQLILQAHDVAHRYRSLVYILGEGLSGADPVPPPDGPGSGGEGV